MGMRDMSSDYTHGTPDECWPWTGHVDKETGYGKTGKVGVSSNWAHRLMYEQLVGPIPDGLTIDHLCHTRDLSCRSGGPCLHRRCVNPAHLEAVTQIENSRRAMAGRMANGRKCGHAYDGNGDCAECARRRAAQFRTKLKTGEASLRIIICDECGRETENCAKGLCRRCYTRNYKRMERMLAARARSLPIPIESQTRSD